MSVVYAVANFQVLRVTAFKMNVFISHFYQYKCSERTDFAH